MTDTPQSGSGRCRILHITQSAGGIETYLLMLFRHIDRSRFELALICPSTNGTLYRKAEDIGVRIYPVSMVRRISMLADIRSLVHIIAAVREFDPDVVHAHSSKAGVLGRIACVLLKKECFYTPNAFAFLGETGFKRRFYLFIEKLMRLMGARIVAASESERMRAIEDVGVKPDLVDLFPNSIETSVVFKISPEDYSSDAPIVLMVGRIVKQKNPEMFLRVARALTEQIHGVKCLMVGAGFTDYSDEKLWSLIRESQAKGDVTVAPWMDREDLFKEMMRARVLVVPSRFESFGYVAAEAQLLGKPVVACDVDGLRDVIESGSTGIMVPLNDDVAMVEAIKRILLDPQEGAAMGEKGRARVKQLFSIEQNIHILEDLYLRFSPRTH